MLITPVKTQKVIVGDKIEQVLKDSLPHLGENSVVVVTSKIVSITEGQVAPLSEDKNELVAKEADKYFVNPDWNEKEEIMLTIKDNMVMYWAGVDESNANGMYILLPKNPMQSAKKIWEFLRKQYNVKNVGVIIADSTYLPLRNGSVSVGLSWYGFEPIKNYIGTKDIFGRKLEYTMTNFVDGVAMAAEFCMGEGDQQQPLAIVIDIPGITFVERDPTKEERDSVGYPLDKDLFGPLIKAVKWEKGTIH